MDGQFGHTLHMPYSGTEYNLRNSVICFPCWKFKVNQKDYKACSLAYMCSKLWAVPLPSTELTDIWSFVLWFFMLGEFHQFYTSKVVSGFCGELLLLGGKSYIFSVSRRSCDNAEIE